MAGQEVDDFIGKVFGDRGQLKVLSWSGERRKGNKLYTVECVICAEDPEMYGHAQYLVPKSHLERGTYPCGCSKSQKLTEQQTLLKIKRACEVLGHTFIRIEGEYDKTNSWVVASCPVHGEMFPKKARDIFTGRGCIECKRDRVRDSMIAPDAHFISRFLATGNFHPDTLFERSDKTVPADRYREGVRRYWKVSCPVCLKVVEGNSSSMLCGHSPCACASYGKVFMYLHTVSSRGDMLALKYGVATSPNKRLKEQNRLCIYDVNRLRLWKFKDSADCRAAEAEIKRTIPSKFLTKEVMKDGWTETCSPEYQDAIENIVIRYGGTLW